MSNMKSMVSYCGGKERQRHRFDWGLVVAVLFVGILCAGTMAGMLYLLYSRMPS